MKLWLDDIRPPHEHGCLGWTWAKTARESIALLKTGEVTEASLDHDLSFDPMQRCVAGLPPVDGEETGYTVVCWMEEHDVWPADGVRVHSMNPVGRERMRFVIGRHYY